MRDWRWPQRTLTFDEDTNFHRDYASAHGEVERHFVSENYADDRDYRFFLLFVWVGGITYLVLAVLGIWKAVQLIGGLV